MKIINLFLSLNSLQCPCMILRLSSTESAIFIQDQVYVGIINIINLGFEGLIAQKYFHWLLQELKWPKCIQWWPCNDPRPSSSCMYLFIHYQSGNKEWLRGFLCCIMVTCVNHLKWCNQMHCISSCTLERNDRYREF